MLSNFWGKVEAYSPPQASTSHDNGDGTQLSDLLELEEELKCFPVFGQLLKPESDEYVVVFLVDRGYMRVSGAA